MQWFGESWGAPICATCEHVAAPQGERCLECTLPIHENDFGFIIPYFKEMELAEAFYHRDCFLNSVLGKERGREFSPPVKGESQWQK